MIGGERADLARQLRRTRWSELVGVKAGAHSVIARGFENAPRLRGRVHAALAEHIREPGQLLRGDRGNHFADQQIDVALAIVPVLGWKLVRAQERGYHFDGMSVGAARQGAKLLELVLGGKTVARFRFDRRGPLKMQPIQARANEIGQLFLRRGARRAHRRLDSAAGSRDLLIRFAAQPALELVVAPARKGKVGVRIDEPGDDHATARIEANCAGRKLHRFVGGGRRPDPRDRMVRNCDAGIGDAPDLGEIFAAAWAGESRPLHGENFSGVFEKKIANGTNHRSVIPGRSSPFSLAHSMARS